MKTTENRNGREVVVFRGMDKQDFVIDKDDYLVISEILLASGQSYDDLDTKINEIIDNDDECGVHDIFTKDASGSCFAMSIGKMRNFTRIGIWRSKITSLPPSIGQLQSLQELQLGFIDTLSSLPHEIGSLSNLKILFLLMKDIAFLPPSIGQLQNLETLELVFTEKLLSLPEELGNLCKLRKLNLSHSGTAFLPSSIGRLQNLETLDLSLTNNLSSLPVEIWSLMNLKDLNLSNLWSDNIRVIPSAIWQLRSLEKLNASGAKMIFSTPAIEGEVVAGLNNIRPRGYSGITPPPLSSGQSSNTNRLAPSTTVGLSVLSEEIGNLVWLKFLDLSSTAIQSLPSSIGNLVELQSLMLYRSDISSLPDSLFHLKKLYEFNICNTRIPELLHGNDANEFLLPIVRGCRSLGRLGISMMNNRKRYGQVLFALAVNRARIRTGFWSECDDSLGAKASLLPHVLQNATRAFDDIGPLAFGGSSYNFRCKVPEADAIYQLLQDNKEMIIWYLSH